MTEDDVESLTSYIVSLRGQYKMALISKRTGDIAENKQMNQL